MKMLRYSLPFRSVVSLFTHNSHRKSSSNNETKSEKTSVDRTKKKNEDDSLNFDASVLSEYFRKAMGLGSSKPVKQELEELSFRGIVKYIKSEKCKKIVAMVGAGISTSAGIPDFRSPGSGLYSNLAKYNLPYPEAIFDINFFKENPKPFFQLAKELFPGKFNPTPSHHFLNLLHEKGLLVRLYTQNIDGLERRAGIPEDKLIEAHGTCYTSHCIQSSCREEYSLEWMKERIFKDEIPHCNKCEALVKPDIIFFGERLPEKFFASVDDDFSNSDLLLIIGTSLKVQPFASLVDMCASTTPRFLINKTKTENTNDFPAFLGIRSGLEFDSKDNYRDVFWKGDCDDGCTQLADALGWSQRFNELIQASVKSDANRT